MNTGQAWNVLYPAAAAAAAAATTIMMMMMMICRSHLTVNTMQLCYKGKPVNVAAGRREIIVPYSDSHKGNSDAVCHQGLLTGLGALHGLLILRTLLTSVDHTSAVVFEIKVAVNFDSLRPG